MGIDKSLHDGYPSIIINGSRYQFGRELQYNQYLVEHAHIAKDYWVFDTAEDMQAFLVNLPESGDRNRMKKLYPDWSEVTPEQRDAYFEDSRARLRAAMHEKLAAGTVRLYPVYPDDGSGPYDNAQPFRVRDHEPPLERVERQIREYKENHQPPPPANQDQPLGPVIRGLMDHSFTSGLTEAGKLSVLEHLDWEGVSAGDKERILSREIDFSRMSRRGFEFVYQDLTMDRDEPPDGSVARTLFERANAAELSIDTLRQHERAGTQSQTSKPRDREPER